MANRLISWPGADAASLRLIKAAQGIALLGGNDPQYRKLVAMCKAVRLLIEASEEEAAIEVMNEIAELTWSTPMPPLILERRMKSIRSALMVHARRNT